ncbi:MAG: helix-turn-helix domain-containing protein [Planctomycetota bacterium]
MKNAHREMLSTRQLAQSLGVSESSVKRWIDDGEIAAERTAGGHRRITVASAVRFVRQQRLPVHSPMALSPSAAPLLGEVDADAAESCHDALLADDAPKARAIITGRYISGASIAAIGDGLIRPALARLGELWKSDRGGILVEHRAVDTCIQVLSDLIAWLPPLSESAPVAVSAAGPGDPYLLPPMLSAMTLRERGVQSRNLGASTPLATIALAVERYGARVCAVSVSITQDPKRHSEWLDLLDRLTELGAGLVVGGRCVRSVPAQVLARAQVCASVSEIGSFAAGVVHGAGPDTRSKAARSRGAK